MITITERQRYDGLIGIWVCWSLSTVFIGLRVYCKRLRAKRLFWDDWLLAAAWLSLFIVCSVNTVNLNVSVQPGPPSLDTIVLLARINLISVTFSIIASSWSKVSFAVTLLRIADGWIKKFLWAAIILTNLFFGLAATFFWVSCKPIEKAWTPIVPGTCWNPWIHVYVAIAVSAFSGVLDICFAVLPWRILFAVRFIKEKVGIAIAMSMGIAAGIFAFVKCAYFPNLATWADASLILGILGVAEPAVTIIAASIPTMRVLLKEVMGEEAYNHNYRLSAFGNIRSGDKSLHVDSESMQMHSNDKTVQFDTESGGMSNRS